jgi:hypothetical protein
MKIEDLKGLKNRHKEQQELIKVLEKEYKELTQDTVHKLRKLESAQKLLISMERSIIDYVQKIDFD